MSYRNRAGSRYLRLPTNSTKISSPTTDMTRQFRENRANCNFSRVRPPREKLQLAEHFSYISNTYSRMSLAAQEMCSICNWGMPLIFFFFSLAAQEMCSICNCIIDIQALMRSLAAQEMCSICNSHAIPSQHPISLAAQEMCSICNRLAPTAR